MKNKSLYILWGILFIVCAILGAVTEPEGLLKALLVLTATAFFVPGGILLYRAVQDKNLSGVRLIRNLSLGSLALTLALIIINIMSVSLSEETGNVLYGILTVVSSPMVCMQYWWVSIFLWACLLSASISMLRKLKKGA